jgi:hypothetical protein
MYEDIYQGAERILRRPSAGSGLLVTVHSQCPSEWQLIEEFAVPINQLAHLFPVDFSEDFIQ